MPNNSTNGPDFADGWRPATRYPDPAIIPLDPRFENYWLKTAAVERIATGCRWAEGPVWFGDGRFLLNQAETLYSAQIAEPLSPAELGQFLQRRVAVYDKDREGHYNLISALHKAIRGSDPQAALYYLARMLVAGEEPLYVLRRLVRTAVEDIGLADPQAVVQCLAAKDTYQFLGSPEGELAIAQACLYLATAPKSNAAYKAQKAAWRSARETGSLMPPANILNAPTKLMKDIGYGKGYTYDHDAEEGFSGDNYWPAEMEPQTFYEPVERGFERQVKERIAYWNRLRQERG